MGTRKFADIVARVERVRLDFELSKSRFARSLGMAPQTYQNFVGRQGSKPNVDLLRGVTECYGVHPLWLLTGRGPMFLFSGPKSADRSVQADKEINVGATHQPEPGPQALALPPALRGVSELLEQIDQSVALTGSERVALLARVSRALGHYLALCPKEASDELKGLLERVEQKLSNQPSVGRGT